MCSAVPSAARPGTSMEQFGHFMVHFVVMPRLTLFVGDVPRMMSSVRVVAM